MKKAFCRHRRLYIWLLADLALLAAYLLLRGIRGCMNAVAGITRPLRTALGRLAYTVDFSVMEVLYVLAVLAVLIAVLCLRRRKPKPAAAPAPPAAPEAPGIYVRLEILRGAYLGQTLEFTLQRELVIGRDPECDIPFADGAVSRRNSRVFLANDVVYIEDLGSQNGTCVNGTRIEMAQALRSGDEIAVGGVSFRLKF